jgi:hypothetical protein
MEIDLSRAKEYSYRQKSLVQWLKSGEQNTKLVFFWFQMLKYIWEVQPRAHACKDLQEDQIQPAVSTAVISYAAAHPNKARRSPLHWTESVDPSTSHVVYGQCNSRRKELKQGDCRAFQAYAQLIGRIN